MGSNFRRILATAVFSPEGGVAYFSAVLVLNNFTTQTTTFRFFTLFKPQISFQIWFLNNETDSIASVKCRHLQIALFFLKLIADHVTSHKDAISILSIGLFTWRWTLMTVSFEFRNAGAKKNSWLKSLLFCHFYAHISPFSLSVAALMSSNIHIRWRHSPQ